MSKKIAIIIGAGPAGLTAAFELLKRTEITPIVFESTDAIGGISQTINYKGNRMDIGGHRFFSKSERVMNWWMDVFPIQGKPSRDEVLLNIDTKEKYNKTSNGPSPETEDKVMLIRRRLSRIFFLKKFFDYPVSLSLNTVLNLGIWRIIKIGVSYLKVMILPLKDESNLENFYINRFGKELYSTFFEDYTQKLWGVPCREIGSDWGSQRVKGLSITKTLIHALNRIIPKSKSVLDQKKTETSLIEQFFYPKFGPGQLWEEVGNQIISKGGELHKNCKVIAINNAGGKISGVKIHDIKTGEIKWVEADYVFSTMPIKDLISGMAEEVPSEVRKISDGLMYRDFITVGLLLRKLKIKNQTDIKTINDIIPDNWIYVQEREVKMGRIQIFNNWSPYMVNDVNNVWLGMEYFCNEGDNMWTMPDSEFAQFAINELVSMGIAESEDVLDSVVIKYPKTYPAYFGTYKQLGTVQKYLDSFDNLFLIGRNGMHRYNNMDHSMLTAMIAVDNIISERANKDNIWSVNTEEDYHEEK